MRAFLRASRAPAGAWLLLLFLLQGAAAWAQEKCGVCHPEERVAHEVSIHALEEITCTIVEFCKIHDLPFKHCL